MYLTVLWAVPLAVGAAAWLAPKNSAKWISVIGSVLIMFYAGYLYFPYSLETSLLRLIEYSSSDIFGIRYHLAVDGISLTLIWLTAFLTAIALLASWRMEASSAYWASFLALESALFGVFSFQNLFYFYIAWDAALIPMFFIIGLWGSERRSFSAMKFILYTFVGSVVLLVGLIALVTYHHQTTGIWTWDMKDLSTAAIPPGPARWIFAAIVLGFSVKIPLFPLHNWLPDAHTDAPAAGSVMLAGSMLKMGVYGFLKVLVPVFPELSLSALPFFGAAAAVNIVYGAFCAMAQADLKRLVAYTSISHLGFCVLGIFSLTGEGLMGGSVQMINHGLSTGGLFLLIGMIYDRAHRRGIDDFGGLAKTAPWFAFFFGFVMLSSIGLPGLNGFVGEFLTVAGMARVSVLFTVLAATGPILAAAYGLPAYQAVFFRPATATSAPVLDMDFRERSILWVLASLILVLGIYPGPMLDILRPAVEDLALR